MKNNIKKFFKRVRTWFLSFVLKSGNSNNNSISKKEVGGDGIGFYGSTDKNKKEYDYILTPEELADTSKVSDNFFQRQLLLDILQTMSIFTNASVDAINTSSKDHKDGKNAPLPTNLLSVYFTNIFEALALAEKLLVVKQPVITEETNREEEGRTTTTPKGTSLLQSLSITPPKKVGKEEFSQLLLGKRVKLMEQQQQEEDITDNTTKKEPTKAVDKPN